MQPEKDLQYYREHPNELVGKNVRVHGRGFVYCVSCLCADKKHFYTATGWGKTEKIEKFSINIIREVICS